MPADLPTNGSGADRYDSAEQLFNQAKFVLDDEIRFAESLKSSRNALGAVLLALIGLGLFKIDIWGDPEERLRVAAWGLWCIRVSAFGAAGCLGIGFFWLYTERPVFLGRKKRANMWPKPVGFQKRKKGAAVAVLDLDNRWRRALEKSDPTLVMRIRARMYATAYERLTEANRRVRYRIEIGKRWIFGGFVLLLVGLVAYTWMIKVNDDPPETPNGPNHQGREEQAEAANG